MSEQPNRGRNVSPSEAGDLSSWMQSPHRLAVDAKGYVWRAYTDEEFWSMAPVNSDNSPIPQPVTYYVPEANALALEQALMDLADLHHRTLTGSRKHDPRAREFWECDCKTCSRVTALISDSSALKARQKRDDGYAPSSHQRGAGDGTVTLPGRCSWCDCALDDRGLCVDTLCPGSQEDDDDYYRRQRNRTTT